MKSDYLFEHKAFYTVYIESIKLFHQQRNYSKKHFVKSSYALKSLGCSKHCLAMQQIAKPSSILRFHLYEAMAMMDWTSIGNIQMQPIKIISWLCFKSVPHAKLADLERFQAP